MSIHIRHVHRGLNIGLEDLRHAWLLEDPLMPVGISVYRGQLTYRLPRSGKRVSYKALKKGLVKTALSYPIPKKGLPF